MDAREEDEIEDGSPFLFISPESCESVNGWASLKNPRAQALTRLSRRSGVGVFKLWLL